MFVYSSPIKFMKLYSYIPFKGKDRRKDKSSAIKTPRCAQFWREEKIADAKTMQNGVETIFLSYFGSCSISSPILLLLN